MGGNDRNSPSNYGGAEGRSVGAKEDERLADQREQGAEEGSAVEGHN